MPSLKSRSMSNSLKSWQKTIQRTRPIVWLATNRGDASILKANQSVEQRLKNFKRS
jgi:hypothetical protein